MKMKKITILASLIVVLGVLSAPAVAQTGHAGVNYTNYDGDFDDYGIDGAVVFGVGSGMKLKLDAAYVDYEGGGESLGGTAHLMSLNETRAIGGYVGYADFDYEKAYVIGAEYARFLQNGTLALSAGFGEFDEADADMWGVNAEYRIFASDNLRFNAGAGWMNADWSGGDTDAVSVGVGVEYRFANSPISIGASYQYVDFDNDNGDLFGLTLRYDFGNGSLKGRDRNGASTFGAFGGFGAAMALF